MIGKRWAAYAAVLAGVVVSSSCGDTFRPTAIPIPQPGGDPNAVKHAVVVSTNGAAAGAVTNVNLSGDTVVLERTVGVGPVHAGLIAAATKVYIANRGDDSVTALTTFSSLLSRTVSLPAGSSPVFAHTTGNTNVYVANSGSNPDVCGGGPAVGIISVTQDAHIGSICVSGAPVALAQSIDNRKLFSVSAATNSVTVIATQDNVVSSVVPVGTAPVWAVGSTDNRFVFVANSGDGTVSVIDITSETVVATIPVGSNPTFLLYDSSRHRVYVANTGGNSVSIIDSAGATPTLLATVGVGTAPTSVTALADGSRAYVANSGSDTVSVINANSNTVAKTIPVGARPVSIGSGLSSAKVVVANFDGASISVIRTSDDTVVATHPAPKRDFNCTGDACARQNPVFVVVTP